MTNIQQQVQQAIDELVESGAEHGLQVAVYRNGELVVDAVAGLREGQDGQMRLRQSPRELRAARGPRSQR